MSDTEEDFRKEPLRVAQLISGCCSMGIVRDHLKKCLRLSELEEMRGMGVSPNSYLCELRVDSRRTTNVLTSEVNV